HPTCAAAADLTAASTSFGPATAYVAYGLAVDGSIVSRVEPSVASRHSLSIRSAGGRVPICARSDAASIRTPSFVPPRSCRRRSCLRPAPLPKPVILCHGSLARAHIDDNDVLRFDLLDAI